MCNLGSVLVLCLVLVCADCVKYSSKYKSTDLNKLNVRGENVNSTVDPNEDRIENYWPVKIFNCVGSSGMEKCLKIFLLKRMEHVLDVFKREKYGDGTNVSIEFDVVSEIKKEFKWEQYKRMSDGELNKMIFRNIEEIFKDKKTKIVMKPGIDIEVSPNDNGTLYLNIKKDPALQLPRGMQFSKKGFYRLIPILFIPPLIMSAILPFVLPAMKIMVLGIGMLNQMALMGAVFTLMRNNAFSEPTHEKKVIYINDGYKNEKKRPPPVHQNFQSVFSKNPHLLEAFKERYPPHFGFDEHFGGDEEDFRGGYNAEHFSGSNHHPHFGHYDDDHDRKGPYYRNDYSGIKRKRYGV